MEVAPSLPPSAVSRTKAELLRAVEDSLSQISIEECDPDEGIQALPYSFQAASRSPCQKTQPSTRSRVHVFASIPPEQMSTLNSSTGQPRSSFVDSHSATHKKGTSTI